MYEVKPIDDVAKPLWLNSLRDSKGEFANWDIYHDIDGKKWLVIGGWGPGVTINLIYFWLVGQGMDPDLAASHAGNEVRSATGLLSNQV